MAEWTVRRLLDHVQELIGEPVGSFYNISTRLDQMNQAQRELNHETRALGSSQTIPVVAGTRTYTLAADFLAPDVQAPYFRDAGGTITQIQIVSGSYLDRTVPGWQDTALNTGTPQYGMIRNGELTLYPTPDQDGTLTFPYLVEPNELAADADVPFNGLASLNRFAPALAYKVAFVNTIARAPAVASAFMDLYERQERLMRHNVRSNPQLKEGIWPTREA